MATDIRLKQLDVCLGRLEEAQERGEKAVSEVVSGSISALVPTVRSGMSISEALVATFKEQERYMCGGAASVKTGAGAAVGGQLSRDEARTLTVRIRDEGQHLSLLLAEAHDRRAWRSLGYRS